MRIDESYMVTGMAGDNRCYRVHCIDGIAEFYAYLGDYWVSITAKPEGQPTQSYCLDWQQFNKVMREIEQATDLTVSDIF